MAFRSIVVSFESSDVFHDCYILFVDKVLAKISMASSSFVLLKHFK